VNGWLRNRIRLPILALDSPGLVDLAEAKLRGETQEEYRHPGGLLDQPGGRNGT
jgi:hypothetical protein